MELLKADTVRSEEQHGLFIFLTAGGHNILRRRVRVKEGEFLMHCLCQLGQSCVRQVRRTGKDGDDRNRFLLLCLLVDGTAAGQGCVVVMGER